MKHNRMKQTRSFALVFGICGFWAQAAHAEDAFCYVPGAGGGKRDGFVAQVLPPRLAEHNINFVYIDNGYAGPVRERALILIHTLETTLQKRPELRCHWLGYSMGGIVLRYALNHLSVRHPDGRTLPFRDFALSLTTLSTPHRGTPLAKYAAYYRLDRGIEELTEKVVQKFDDPMNVDAYSPLIKDLPNYSFRSYMENEDSAVTPIEQIGFQLIEQELRLHPRAYGMSDRPVAEEVQFDTRNDGIVPFSSQKWGTVLWDFAAPHSGFAETTPSRQEFMQKFYEMYWAFLHGQITSVEPPERFRTGILPALWNKLRIMPPGLPCSSK